MSELKRIIKWLQPDPNIIAAQNMEVEAGQGNLPFQTDSLCGSSVHGRLCHCGVTEK